jgi:hypothetical protein
MHDETTPRKISDGKNWLPDRLDALHCTAMSLQAEYYARRKEFLTDPLTLRVTKHRHLIRVCWYYRRRSGKQACVRYLNCGRSGTSRWVFNSATRNLRFHGSAVEVEWLVDISVRAMRLIWDAEMLSDYSRFCQPVSVSATK